MNNYFLARIADHKGTGWTMFGSAFMLGLPHIFGFMLPINDFIGGIATAGFQQSVFNRLLEIVTENDRQRAIAIYTTLSQISAIYAPFQGMKLICSVSYETCNKNL